MWVSEWERSIQLQDIFVFNVRCQIRQSQSHEFLPRLGWESGNNTNLTPNWTNHYLRPNMSSGQEEGQFVQYLALWCGIMGNEKIKVAFLVKVNRMINLSFTWGNKWVSRKINDFACLLFHLTGTTTAPLIFFLSVYNIPHKAFGHLLANVKDNTSVLKLENNIQKSICLDEVGQSQTPRPIKSKCKTQSFHI